MNFDAIRETLHRQPFAPFRLHLADGRVLSVPHPEFMAAMPNVRRVIVTDADGNWDVINHRLVTSIEYLSTPPDQRSA